MEGVVSQQRGDPKGAPGGWGVAQLFSLGEEQLEPIRPFFAQERGVKRVDHTKWANLIDSSVMTPELKPWRSSVRSVCFHPLR